MPFILAVVCAPAVPAASANLAPTITVDELVAPGAGCSLREAVLQANTNVVVDPACGPAGDDTATDTIVLAPGAAYSLTLAGAEDLAAAGDLDLMDNSTALDLNIVGSGSTIANASSPKDRVIHVLPGAQVSIAGVTIANGLAAGISGAPFPMNLGDGGGILNQGSLTASDCALIGNRALGAPGVAGGSGGDAFGGAISTTGPLTLTDCVVRNNLAIGGDGASPPSDVDTGRAGSGVGGGISLREVSLVTLVRTRLEANEARGGAGGSGPSFASRAGFGGGGAFWGGSLDARDSTFADNLAKGGRGGSSGSGAGGDGAIGEGGGLALQSGSHRINGSTLSGNRAEGGDGGPGAASVGSRGTAQGGAVFKLLGLLSVDNSTLSGNVAQPGEGAGSESGSGGGIFVSMGGAFLDSVTLTASRPHGISSDGTVTATNSIIALQTSGPDCFGSTFFSNDYNLDSDGSCGLSQPHDQSGVPSLLIGLGPLADNGGLTETHAITPGLAAYNHGSTTLASDQRGVSRPQWGIDDVGAFEQERQVSAIEIPALSRTASVALAGLLALAGLFGLRRWG